MPLGRSAACSPPATSPLLKEAEAELEGAMEAEGAGAASEVEQRVAQYDRVVLAYGEARAAIKSVLALGQGKQAGWPQRRICCCPCGCCCGRAELVMQLLPLGPLSALAGSRRLLRRVHAQCARLAVAQGTVAAGGRKAHSRADKGTKDGTPPVNPHPAPCPHRRLASPRRRRQRAAACRARGAGSRGAGPGTGAHGAGGRPLRCTLRAGLPGTLPMSRAGRKML